MTAPLKAALLVLAAAAPAHDEGPAGDVVLVKAPGISAYEEVAESFKEHCRVQVRAFSLEESRKVVVRRIAEARLVVAVGQGAVDLSRGARTPMVYALAVEAPHGAISSESSAPPEAVFRALLKVRPSARLIGVVAGKRAAARLAEARAAARLIGMDIIDRHAESGPQAILALKDLRAQSPPPDALWIGADPQLITTPVFQYLLRMQLEQGIPVLASTRQQVRMGAFLSVDWQPRAVGRRLAALTNMVLDGNRHPLLSGREDPAGLPEVSINQIIARKIGVDLDHSRAAGFRVE